jgi:hypothetical protein
MTVLPVATPLAPELIKVAASERRNALIYVTVNLLLASVSFVNALKMGFV